MHASINPRTTPVIHDQVAQHMPAQGAHTMLDTLFAFRRRVLHEMHEIGWFYVVIINAQISISLYCFWSEHDDIIGLLKT